MSVRSFLFACAWAVCPSTLSAADLSLSLGGDEDLAETLTNASLLVQVQGDGASTRRDLVAAAQADYRRLLAVLWDAGYFGPTVSITVDGVEAAALPTVGGTGPVSGVAINVTPGPIFLFGQAKIGPIPPGTELPEGFAPGERAGTSILRETASAGVEAWRGRGHAKAELASQDIQADHRATQLNADLTLAPGPKLSYGAVTVEGNEDVDTDHLLRIVDLRQGRVFDPEEVRASARRLQRTGAFRSVSIVEGEEILAGDQLPMKVQVVERLPRRFGAGAEVGTTEGLSLSAFWLHRNLTGHADSLRVEGAVEGIGGDSGDEDLSIGFAYNRPATFNPETDLFVTGQIERLDQETFSSNSAELVVGARRIVSDEFQYSYALAYERSRVTDAFGTRTFNIFSIPLEAQYDRRNDPLNPTDGYYVEAGLEPFHGFTTAGSGLRFTADLRGYQHFGAEDQTVLAARLQLGSVVGPNLSDVPADDLFFSGGGGTVRGQPFQDLGVTLPSGRVVGARSFVGLSTEVRQQITDTIGLVGFVDAGRISEGSDWSDGQSHVGAGLGVRYNTGIGPIRVDVGLPVSGPGSNTGLELYIGIGQAF
ncbi:outer membrane protein assembly factor [Jannaschia pagri]|uniref:Outer membrane protein assembly factor n=1 Tax=Jannaschia pagri TaxID=2829797 RepID=A0ABQ4NQW7_9RHOB|nr:MULTISPECIES: autotransporter assembly complex family protein [unclassified Jannaschia]GIT92968.1 outer membrane protein assembly factor [Jannaschia sp. AI_61]GIT96803.1 outer membrane protein assembly factor [Jannaschia sp. AI_62]